jgi:putative ABC transport system substrate-binding protein
MVSPDRWQYRFGARGQTTTVPIVFVIGGDPVRDGLVASLNRPGGNVTGVSFISVELGEKQLGHTNRVASTIFILIA